MSLASVGYREVEAIVEQWTNKYQYHISLLDSKPNQARYPQYYLDLWSNSVYHKPKNLFQLQLLGSILHAPTMTTSISLSGLKKIHSFIPPKRPSGHNKSK